MTIMMVHVDDNDDDVKVENSITDDDSVSVIELDVVFLKIIADLVEKWVGIGRTLATSARRRERDDCTCLTSTVADDANDVLVDNVDDAVDVAAAVAAIVANKGALRSAAKCVGKCVCWCLDRIASSAGIKGGAGG